MTTFRTLLAISALSFQALHAEAPPAANSAGFVRSAERADKTTAFETRSAEYLPAKGDGPAVWLIGVAHIGTPEYYAALQQQLDRHSVVLFEGVGLGEALKKGPGSATRDAGVQAGLAKALGLVFQLDAIDYRRPHFLNSDVQPDQLVTEMKDRAPADSKEKSEDLLGPLMDALHGTGALGAMMNNLISVLGETPAMQEMTKAVLVEALGRSDELMGLARTASPAMKDLFDVMITKRNSIVLTDLRTQLARRKPGETVAIFYGAAHMDDFAARLRDELHYAPAKDVWLTAFTADPAKGGINPVQMRFMIEMAKMQLKALQSPPSAK